MAQLSPDIAPKVVAACQANAEEAAAALGRALDGEFVLKVGEATDFASESAAASGEGGLVATFQFGEEHALAFLSDGSGLVPEWTHAPDPTGASKLSTLAQELSMLLMPDDLMADAFEAAWVEDLPAALERVAPLDDAKSLVLELAAGESLGALTLVWAVKDATAALSANSADTAATGSESGSTTDRGNGQESSAEAPQQEASQSRVLRNPFPTPRDFRELPPNAVSVLQVGVQVSVNLAAKKVRLSEVVELGPGSIITFNKPCDDPLQLTVGDRPIAHGEAVKVGERFGVRVQEMILPDEHFRPMLPPKAS